ncbi:hypothetical protein [Methanospirillum hungatei]|uniref:hypothetical protein n=1 Tax=Methanospirillum hungatei TaxID=2203 RepID=UPI001B4834A9|nr:hypothetical protein [Methanospirillum hungatei]MBP7034402.1 hypothetical protein [Methanospirillum sp.]HOW04712.1 hypothetical protein [Methanospirillum hungatei]
MVTPMHPINSAVQALVPMMEECGIAESPVLLTPDYDLPRCAYEKGVPIQVIFGGRSAVFVANEIIKATTKASFMSNAPLKKASQRAAAAGILNAVTGFLCTTRKLHACRQEEHSECRAELATKILNKRIYCYGDMPDARKLAGNLLVNRPEDADVVLVTGDGLIGDDAGILSELSKEKVLYLGPSTVGTAQLLHCEHFCPFGRGNLQTSED